MHDAAEVREIQIRRRPPEEVRARLLASDLPRDLAGVLADEIAPEGLMGERPASMLQQVEFSGDDEGELRRVPMRPVTDAEEAQDVW